MLAGLFFVVGTLPQAISPWGAVTLSNTSGVSDPNLHRWSAALAGGPDCGMAAILFYLAWRPLRAPAVVQWIALAVIVFLTANVPFVGPAVALVAVPVVLVLVAYPAPRGSTASALLGWPLARWLPLSWWPTRLLPSPLNCGAPRSSREITTRQRTQST